MKKSIGILYSIFGMMFLLFIGKCYPKDFIDSVNFMCHKHGIKPTEVWFLVGIILFIGWPIWLIYVLINLVIS